MHHPTHTEAHQPCQPGEVLCDRYVVGEQLGAGGFATVYAGRDQQVDRDVAIKALGVVGLDDASQRERFSRRFEREALTMARISHPNALVIFDFGTSARDVPFLVMERLYGHDLEAHLRRVGAMKPADALRLFVPALEALGVAHEAGVIHRDLKPSNLFLRYPGERRESLCVVDFGIARLQDVNTRLTGTGQLVGTPSYVAPEYAVSQEVSPATDIYQMGLILVEALSGRPVVQGPDALIAMFQHVNGNLSIPTPLLDSPLGPVLQRALAVDPRQRHASAYELADALAAIDPRTIPLCAPDTPRRRLTAPAGAVTPPEHADQPVDHAAAVASLREKTSPHLRIDALADTLDSPAPAISWTLPLRAVAPDKLDAWSDASEVSEASSAPIASTTRPPPVHLTGPLKPLAHTSSQDLLAPTSQEVARQTRAKLVPWLVMAVALGLTSMLLLALAIWIGGLP